MTGQGRGGQVAGVVEMRGIDTARPARTHRVPEKIEVRTPHGRVVIFPNTPDDTKAALVATLDQIGAKGQVA